MSSQAQNLETGAMAKGKEYLDKLQGLLRDITACLSAEGKYKLACSMAAVEAFAKTLPYVNQMIYPWRNFDWDYLMYVQQNYHPIRNLHASADGTISALVDDIDGLIKLVGGLLLNPNPADNSKAGDPSAAGNDLCPDIYPPLISAAENVAKIYQQRADVFKRIPLLVAQGQAIQEAADKFKKTAQRYREVEKSGSCYLLRQYREKTLDQKAPYDDPFFDMPLDGRYSSSYFAMVGVCETEYNDKTTCQDHDYIWVENPGFNDIHGPLTGTPAEEEHQLALQEASNLTEGNCFRGKYAYIDNKPGFPVGKIQNMNGLIPSIIEDMTKLSPDKMMAVAMGQGVPGFAMQHCETFQGSTRLCPSSIWRWILCFLVISVLLGIGYILNS